jgi:hypothetical protein
MKDWRIKFVITEKQAYIFLFSVIAADVALLAFIIVYAVTRQPDASLYHINNSRAL